MKKKVQQYKKDAIADLRGLLKDCNNYVLLDYRGLKVKELTSLRQKLREHGVRFQVVKNSYLKIALKQEGKAFEDALLKGPTAIALMEEDANQAVKVLVDFPHEKATLEIKGGVIENQLFDHERLLAFSKLPGKAELIAKLLGTLNAPAQHVAGVLNASVAQLLYALKAIQEKQEA